MRETLVKHSLTPPHQTIGWVLLIFWNTLGCVLCFISFLSVIILVLFFCLPKAKAMAQSSVMVSYSA